MPKPGTGQELVLPKCFPCGMPPVAATFLHSFSSVPLHSERQQKNKQNKQTGHWYMSEGSREAILFYELAVTDFLAVDLELV